MAKARKPPGRAAPLLGNTVRTAIYLAQARIELIRLTTAQIDERNRLSARQGRVMQSAASLDIELVGRAVWIVPRVAGRMPFRSDCLVQAMAAQDFLLHFGLSSRIVIGVEGGGEKSFSSHAWLECADIVVVGGEIGQFNPILGKD